MNQIHSEALLHAEGGQLRRLMEVARDLSRNRFGNELYCYFPDLIHYEGQSLAIESKPVFKAISITGTKCALNCSHCQGKILEGMIAAPSPKRLIEECERLAYQGYKGCLISGGCLPNGSIPLLRFVDSIAEIKRRLGFTIVVHTGLVSKEEAEKLGKANIDAGLIDVIGSIDTIREVYHLKANPEDYKRSLLLLKKAGVPIAPHIVIGLHHGRIKGEVKALEVASEVNPDALILVVLMPLAGTPMERVSPPSPLEISKIVLMARFLLPDVPVLLGCARPRGFHRVKTDILAILSGVNGIAYPSEQAIDFARRLGLDIKISQMCCSLIFKELKLLLA